MFLRFLQIAFLLSGLALIVDFVTPSRQQQSVVTGHSHTSDTEGESVYTVVLSGGDIESCSLDSDAFSSLKEGDEVQVRANQLFDTCTRVTRGDQVVYSTWAQPFVGLLAGILLFGFGLMLFSVGTKSGQSSVSPQ